MKALADTNFDRFNANLKDIRNILIAILGVSRPWEVLVGQAIAKLTNGHGHQGEHSLRNYLGEKVSTKILKI